jgi:hypothetical protein
MKRAIVRQLVHELNRRPTQTAFCDKIAAVGASLASARHHQNSQPVQAPDAPAAASLPVLP